MTNKTPTPQPFLVNLDTYLPGKSGNKGEKIIKLSSNENPNGPSPKAVEAYAQAASQLHRYPQDGALALREAIASKHGFAAQQIICGAGSDDIIRMLCHAYAGTGDEVLYSQYGFAMYRIYAQQHGATAIAAPEENLRTNLKALLGCVSRKTKLVFLANPNNPSGSYLSKEELHELRHKLRDDIILVLDGAYAEYMTASDYSDGRKLVATSNTVIMRTFSKAYGLSSLRVGWGYGPQAIIDILYKTRSPFNITQPSLNAAIAALQDEAYLQAHVQQNNEQRELLEADLAQLGLTVLPCHANFVLIECAQANGKTAHEASEHLKNQGIIVRELANYGLPNHLRISIGTPEENTAMLAALTSFLNH